MRWMILTVCLGLIVLGVALMGFSAWGDFGSRLAALPPSVLIVSGALVALLAFWGGKRLRSYFRRRRLLPLARRAAGDDQELIDQLESWRPGSNARAATAANTQKPR